MTILKAENMEKDRTFNIQTKNTTKKIKNKKKLIGILISVICEITLACLGAREKETKDNDVNYTCDPGSVTPY